MRLIKLALTRILDRWPEYILAVGFAISVVWLAVLVWFGARLYQLL
jgi:hypothetical protein